MHTPRPLYSTDSAAPYRLPHGTVFFETHLAYRTRPLHPEERLVLTWVIHSGVPQLTNQSRDTIRRAHVQQPPKPAIEFLGKNGRRVPPAASPQVAAKPLGPDPYALFERTLGEAAAGKWQGPSTGKPIKRG
jgi:hypothetical protein